MKIALITGSSRGIGKAIAKTLAKEDYAVIINGRNAKDVQAASQEIQNEGGQAHSLVADLSTQEGISEMKKLIETRWGHLNLLVTNIGSGKSTPGVSVPLEEWKRVFDVNFFSAVLAINVHLPLIEKCKGQIIAISSIAGCEAFGLAPIPYSVAKNALISYIKNITRPLSEKGIRVNCVSPGNVLFENGSWELRLKSEPQKTKDYIQSHVPLKNFITPEEIANTVHFISKSPNMTGQNIIVDGGQTNQL